MKLLTNQRKSMVGAAGFEPADSGTVVIKTIIISAAYNMYACKKGDLQNECGTRTIR
jgi:hypothetical protein